MGAWLAWQGDREVKGQPQHGGGMSGAGAGQNQEAPSGLATGKWQPEEAEQGTGPPAPS